MWKRLENGPTAESLGKVLHCKKGQKKNRVSALCYGRIHVCDFAVDDRVHRIAVLAEESFEADSSSETADRKYTFDALLVCDVICDCC